MIAAGVSAQVTPLFVGAAVTMGLTCLTLVLLSCPHPPSCASGLIVVTACGSIGVTGLLFMALAVVCLAFQAVVTLRHLLQGAQPARPDTGPPSLDGHAIGAGSGIRAYPFRDRDRAVLALVATPLNTAGRLVVARSPGVLHDLFANPQITEINQTVRFGHFQIIGKRYQAVLSKFHGMR